ncbi:unnamed protein product [Allacma fusca]|uniref:Uncharacterized protein n=1 Tax=Allacma fusca TaxID=39272 RepID=A0A8J2Q2D1_9HEXA|nr:unnamed protein product [Allacma fusca]
MLTSLKNCLIVLAVFAADILAGVFLPLTTCTIASIFDTSAPVIYRDIYIKDDVAQLLLSIIFLVQLQFVYTYCIHSFVILKLHSFQLQAIILELSHHRKDYCRCSYGLVLGAMRRTLTPNCYIQFRKPL